MHIDAWKRIRTTDFYHRPRARRASWPQPRHSRRASAYRTGALSPERCRVDAPELMQTIFFSRIWAQPEYGIYNGFWLPWIFDATEILSIDRQSMEFTMYFGPFSTTTKNFGSNGKLSHRQTKHGICYQFRPLVMATKSFGPIRKFQHFQTEHGNY